MEHFLCQKDVVAKQPALDEAALVGSNDQREEGGEAAREDLGEDLIRDIA